MDAIEQAGTTSNDSATVVDNTAFGADDGSNTAMDFDLNAIIAEASRAAEDAVSRAAEDTIQGSTPYASNPAETSAFTVGVTTQSSQQPQNRPGNAHQPDLTSAVESASRFSQLALQNIQQNQYRPTPSPQTNCKLFATTNRGPDQAISNNKPAQPVLAQGPPIYPAQQQANTQQQYYRYPQQPTTNMQSNYQAPSSENLPPNQSETTSVLYERARQAAAARSSTHARREGSHSTRRPWAPEEEKALMMGLDMVRGPHWSQILSLFGPNGTVSTILADRTQVQLKDKARNLKLFFLKTNSEMPYYLQCVTGELKTRAPSQAARKEAEERARMNSEDEQARINGIMTLGNLGQNGAGQGPRSNASIAVTPNSTSAQQTPHAHPVQHPGTPVAAHLQNGQPAPGRAATAAQGVPAAQPTHLSQPTARPQIQQGQVQAQSQPQGQPQPQYQAQNQPRTQPQSQPSSQPQMQTQQRPLQSNNPQYQQMQQQQQQQQPHAQQLQPQPLNHTQQSQPGQPRTEPSIIKKEEAVGLQGLNAEETALLELQKAIQRENAAQEQAQLMGKSNDAAVPTT